jgi:tetratricopeptide (TPR) repeat protein
MSLSGASVPPGSDSVGLCMIVKNEAARLPRCLAAVQGFVQEMVIVDTGSTDQTVAIAKAAGARVYHLDWPNDFAVARNYALGYVTSDWVLVLDADEVWRPDIVPLLLPLLQNHPQQLVINLLRQEVGAAQTPYSLVSRLFRRHSAIRFERPFHELIDPSVERLLLQEPDWQVSNLLDVAIDHYGYDATTEVSQQALQQKLGRAQTMMQAYLQNHPNDAYVCSKLGGLYIQTGEIVSGLALLQQGLALEGLAPQAPHPQDPHTRYELHYHLGLAYSAQQQWNVAAEHYQAALTVTLPEPLKIGARTNLGSLLQDQGILDVAYQQFQQVANIAPDFAVGQFNLGVSLRALGELAAAAAAYQRAIILQPTYAEAYQNLGAVLLAQGQIDPSLAAFRQAIALLEPRQPDIAQHLRTALAEMGLQV